MPAAQMRCSNSLRLVCVDGIDREAFSLCNTEHGEETAFLRKENGHRGRQADMIK